MKIRDSFPDVRKQPAVNWLENGIAIANMLSGTEPGEVGRSPSFQIAECNQS
jgi:hypothetical protein